MQMINRLNITLHPLTQASWYVYNVGMEDHVKSLKSENPQKVSLLSRTLPINLKEPSEPDAEMRLTLRIGANTPPNNIPLDRNVYTIGRDAQADICIPDPSVSRQHARIFFLHDEEILEDLNSTNGSFVNGVRVTRCVMQDNDIIRIGDATILFSRKTASQTDNRTSPDPKA